jgi:GT2 family glycosyltransferase
MAWKPDVSVVVVTGLVLDALKLCVATLKATTNGSLEIVLVLCNATSGVKEWAYQQQCEATDENPVAVCVYNPRGNLDVYASYNYGVKKVRGDKVCLLNDDMLFAPEWDVLACEKLEPNILMTGVVVEPGFVSVSDRNVAYNFGMDPSHFNESAFRDMAKKYRKPKVLYDTRGWYMPAMFITKDFLDFGGYNTAKPFPHANDVEFFHRWTAAGKTTARCDDMLCYHFQRLSQRPLESLYWGPNLRDGWTNASDEGDVGDLGLKDGAGCYGNILCDGAFDEYGPESLREVLQSLYCLLTPDGVLTVEFDDILSRMLAFKRAGDDERYGPCDGTPAIETLKGTRDKPLLGGYTPNYLRAVLVEAGFLGVKVNRGHIREWKITGARASGGDDDSPGSDS